MMKSPQLDRLYAADDSERDRYSELTVMRSAAGYYVGSYYSEDFGSVPGTRDSGYFASETEAAAELARYRAGEPTARVNP
jgi:hypothetical protein